ncbi:MAG: hypothetical protein MI863_13665 [Desulfobacterales bacterium]|nr:hypothetical protein [Desulfobacterales bacterium]
MDQDFHYYGAYYAARIGGGFSREEATTIAKASNFIDFLDNERYGGYWRMVGETRKKENRDYTILAEVDYPRYSFQGSWSTGVSGSRGLWASFHFTPGNYPDPGDAPTHEEVHGAAVASDLPGHLIRDVDLDEDLGIDADIAKLLNRPQSALSRCLIRDTVRCLRDKSRLEAILGLAAGGKTLLEGPDKEDVIRRFGLLLLGGRAHTIADTWAHQDWSATNKAINTYWDISGDYVPSQIAQKIKYRGADNEDWTTVRLSSGYLLTNENLVAVPNNTTYMGHGWMGHLPDFSFIKYQYRPCWHSRSKEPVQRDNPVQYSHAFLELCSLFSQANGSLFDPGSAGDKLEGAKRAMSAHWDIGDGNNCPRGLSAGQWITEMGRLDIQEPSVRIDTKEEPDKKAILDGQIDYKSMGGTRYGTYYVNLFSDLYLFQIAIDYNFQFVKHWTAKHDIGANLFNGSWSQAYGPLPEAIEQFLDD